MLDLAAMKDLVSKKVVGSAVKREAVAYLRTSYGLSERLACHIVGADRTMIRYRSRRAPCTVKWSPFFGQFGGLASDYNTERPHSALDYQTPADYAWTLAAAIARPAARDESSARRAIAQPAPTGVNTYRTTVATG